MSFYGQPEKDVWRAAAPCPREDRSPHVGRSKANILCRSEDAGLRTAVRAMLGVGFGQGQTRSEAGFGPGGGVLSAKLGNHVDKEKQIAHPPKQTGSGRVKGEHVGKRAQDAIRMASLSVSWAHC